MSLVLASEGQERADHVVVGEMVSRDTVVAGVVEHLPRGAGAALARVPGVALDPVERLVDAFLDEQPPNTARGYRTDLAHWATWLAREAPPEYRIHPLLSHSQ
jgi:hypothetical protein